MKTTVTLIKTDSYDRADASIRRSLELLGGIDRFLHKGMRVLIKPNLLFGLPPEKCVTTHPAVVKSVIGLVKQAGCVPVMGDSPVIGAGAFHAKRAGFRDLCREMNVQWIDFESDAVEMPGKTTFKKIEIARIAAEADAIINLPKVKTHGQTYLTMAVKNMFGIIPGVRKARWHLTSGADTVKFGEMLTEVCYLRKPVLNIVDGIQAMDGNGPRGGNPYPLHFLIAGEDPSAVDTAVCRLLKTDPHKVPTIAAARNTGLGVTDLTDIEFLGDAPGQAEVKKFRFSGQHLPAHMGKLNFLAPFAKQATTSRPIIDHPACTRCEQCVHHCPAEAMNLQGTVEQGKVLIDLDKCIRCYCCSEVCPEGAISVGQGWLWKFVPGMMK